MIRFLCQTCGKSLKAPDESAGKNGKCSRCGSISPIPDTNLDSLDEVNSERSAVRTPIDTSNRDDQYEINVDLDDSELVDGSFSSGRGLKRLAFGIVGVVVLGSLVAGVLLLRGTPRKPGSTVAQASKSPTPETKTESTVGALPVTPSASTVKPELDKGNQGDGVRQNERVNPEPSDRVLDQNKEDERKRQIAQEYANPVFDGEADELRTQFAKDKNAGGKKFEGRVVRVSGIVASIPRNLIENPSITMSRNDGPESAVSCKFWDSEVMKLANLRIGERVDAVGRCDGIILGAVILRECQIVPTRERPVQPLASAPTPQNQPPQKEAPKPADKPMGFMPKDKEAGDDKNEFAKGKIVFLGREAPPQDPVQRPKPGQVPKTSIIGAINVKSMDRWLAIVDKPLYKAEREEMINKVQVYSIEDGVKAKVVNSEHESYVKVQILRGARSGTSLYVQRSDIHPDPEK